MNVIGIAALAIGGSTLLGTGCGFLFHRISDAWNRLVTAFAAGVMLAAAMFGLFQPAMEMGCGPVWIIIGAVSGMLFLRIAAKIMPGGTLARHPELMFVLALAMHKFPEGMAGGVGLGGGAPQGVMVAIGVAIQNFPEGVVMIPPLLAAGVKKSRAAFIALLTGILNALGVLAGGCWGSVSGNVLPAALAFAGGAMLDVIARNMIPQVFAPEAPGGGEWILMGGFLAMVAVNMIF